MSTKPKAPHKCHDCGVHEGELHDRGCDMERCPFCGGQLISCGCCYKPFYPYDPRMDMTTFEPVVPFFGLPEEVYGSGLPAEQEAEFEKLLEAKGRIPYIVYPNMCAKCGALWPEMFRVSDEEWASYIEPRERDKMLCRPCYDWIKKVIDAARAKRG